MQVRFPIYCWYILLLVYGLLPTKGDLLSQLSYSRVVHTNFECTTLYLLFYSVVLISLFGECRYTGINRGWDYYSVHPCSNFSVLL
jgi:hypothetical protein